MKRPRSTMPSRRTAFASATGLASAGLVQLRTAVAGAARKPAFFTPAEIAMLDELCELIIPADDHSPGARAAAVAWDIDRRLAERLPRIPDHAATRKRWRAGLRATDASSRALHRKPFMRATPEERTAVLEAMAAGEAAPQTLEHRFFVELKAMTAASYYTSEVGIHADIGYRGNSYFEEFVGIDAKPAPKPKKP